MEIKWRWFDGVLPEGDTLAFDVENDHYQLKAAKSKAQKTVTQCAVSNGTDTVVARDSALVALLDALSVYPGILVAQNGWHADVPWIRQTIPSFPYNQGETMALGYLDDENQSLALQAMCIKYLGVDEWKEGITLDQSTDEFAEYNARDALYTMQLYTHLSEKLQGRCNIVSRIILPGMLALLSASERGIWIDPGAVSIADEYYSTRISAVLNRLQAEHGIDRPTKRRLVAQALLDDGHKLSTTKSGQLSTSKGTLGRLKKTDLVNDIQKFNSLNKAYTAYVKRYQQISSRGDGRSHSPYSIIRTVTGRTSSPDQQLPRTPLLRAFFSAPAGFRLVSADYNALQFRTAAWVAGEQGLLRHFQQDPGFDPHRFFASILYGKPERDITKDERQIAKSANFGLLFMAQPGTLVEYVYKTTSRVLTQDEARHIYEVWHATYPGFGRYYLRTWDELVEHGYVESFSGRRRHLPEFNVNSRMVGRIPRWKRHAGLREAVNFTMGQAPEADITQIALAKCHQEGLPLNGFVHDSISFEFDEFSPIPEDIIQYCMCEYPPLYLKEHFGADFSMPLRIEIK
jgi:DNA polymerase-1